MCQGEERRKFLAVDYQRLWLEHDAVIAQPLMGKRAFPSAILYRIYNELNIDSEYLATDHLYVLR